MEPDSSLRRVRVWDLPTRLFHWSLAVAVAASFVTAKLGGNAMAWHLRLGLLALALLAFRVLWGFFGGHWSRFASFIYLPASLRDYLRGSSGPGGRFEIGHSPLGALAVFAMLGLLAVQVATGLVADDEVATVGPLNRFVSSALAARASAWHSHWGQWLIFALVGTHVVAVLYYLRVRKNDILRPMLHGDKPLPPDTTASADGWARRLLALALFGATATLAWWVGQLGQ
ncbi:MAG: cytochrome b/b6 domain-containing protein [Aquincola sp.]|nr:cytochrome b/b6 domain-containing protein [Aquincola sp.]MDH4288278.1 cytochrome b/b6 domain-containing protein [Aquincola sp.]MDH5329917.1 cytochrome b/b6 domain-containing protein [Aquincola sp.]